jgi:ribosomal protein S14
MEDRASLLSIKLYDPKEREREKAEERRRDQERIRAGDLAAVVAKNNPLRVTRECLRELTTDCGSPHVYPV